MALARHSQFQTTCVARATRGSRRPRHFTVHLPRYFRLAFQAALFSSLSSLLLLTLFFGRLDLIFETAKRTDRSTSGRWWPGWDTIVRALTELDDGRVWEDNARRAGVWTITDTERELIVFSCSPCPRCSLFFSFRASR